MAERICEQETENIQISCMPCDLDSAREVLYGLGLHSIMIASVQVYQADNTESISVSRIFASCCTYELARLDRELSGSGIEYGIAKVEADYFDG